MDCLKALDSDKPLGIFLSSGFFASTRFEQRDKMLDLSGDDRVVHVIGTNRTDDDLQTHELSVGG